MRHFTRLKIVAFAFLAAQLTWAQAPGVVLSGTVRGPDGSAVQGAAISVKNLSAETTVETQSDASGRYSVANLAPGRYEVTASAAGLAMQRVTITIAAGGAAAGADFALLAAGAGATSGPPSLGDLGFPNPQTQGSAADQARLDRRSHMLQMHQRLGLITAAPLVATLIASGGAGGRSTSSGTRDLHAALGSVTAGMYIWTASYAIRAPRIPGTPTRGPIRVHKALAWVHGTGMILTPVLGAMAFHQKSQGERVHGIASAHGAAAWITGVAYGAALVSVSFKF